MSKFTCANCRGTFEQGWSDEEADADALAEWGVANASQDPSMEVVCDDCYNQMMAAMTDPDWQTPVS